MSASPLAPYLILLAEWIGVIAIVMLLGLSGRFKRRPLVFKYPRREAAVAAGLWLLLTVGWYLAAQWLRPKLPALLPEMQPSAWVFSQGDLWVLLAFGLGGALIFAAAVLLRGQPWLSAGFSPQTMRASLSLSFALALIAIFLRGKIFTILNGLSADEGLFFIAALLFGLAMEFIFRGYLQPRLSALLGETQGWLAAALAFAIASLPLYSALNATGVVALNFALLLLFGLLQGWIFRKSGHVLAPALYHAVHLWLLAI
jgi:membrane protease YdiL (CAAX protease family)